VKSTRWRTEAALAVLLAVVLLALAAGVVRFVSKTPVHEDAAAVPSTASAAPTDQYAGSVGESRRLARALVVDDNLPGLSVAVAVDGEIVWAEGFGWSDVESRTPLTPLTRFRLGAVSKPLTAVAAALLHDQGRLDLDAPVQRYVPAYPKKQWTVTPPASAAPATPRPCSTVATSTEIWNVKRVLSRSRTRAEAGWVTIATCWAQA
jgi:serine beta-lactamase-like protein LACTB, mitochondrial